MTKYLNKTKIEWCDYTFNPATGCLHTCPYCYARKLAENPFYTKAFPHGFEPHFYPERVDAPLKLKTPAKIFLGSMTDMFGEWVNGEWLLQIFSMMSAADWHTFFILTKNPRGIRKIYEKEAMYYLGGGDYLSNVFLGVSVNRWSEFNRINILRREWSGPKFISFEPLINTDIHEPDLTDINWIIIGGQTKPTKYPNPHQVANLIHAADKHNIPVFMKNNVGENVFKYCGKRQEFPE